MTRIHDIPPAMSYITKCYFLFCVFFGIKRIEFQFSQFYIHILYYLRHPAVKNANKWTKNNKKNHFFLKFIFKFKKINVIKKKYYNKTKKFNSTFFLRKKYKQLIFEISKKKLLSFCCFCCL